MSSTVKSWFNCAACLPRICTALSTIPHVTQHDNADITDLEAFRKQQNKALEREGVKLTMLAFLVAACAKALKEFPRFNSSLENSGEALIHKHYINIGIAVDTPNGLVVPVIKDADKKTLKEIAQEMGELAEKARNRKLTPADMKGGTFSISSLGGIGGTAFARRLAQRHPQGSCSTCNWCGWQSVCPAADLAEEFVHDHRVIDGADGTVYHHLSRCYRWWWCCCKGFPERKKPAIESAFPFKEGQTFTPDVAHKQTKPPFMLFRQRQTSDFDVRPHTVTRRFSLLSAPVLRSSIALYASLSSPPFFPAVQQIR